MFNSLRNFLDFQKGRNEPAQEWDLGSVLIFFEHRRWILLEEYDLRIKIRESKNLQKSARVPPKSHLNRYVAAFRKFVEIAWTTDPVESDLKISQVEEKDWESVYQCPRKQAGEIPAPGLMGWETYVSESSGDLPGRLFAWHFMISVASCLRWGDLLNTAPGTTVLMKEGLIGFAEKPRPVESLKEDHVGEVIFLFLMKSGCLKGIDSF